MKNVAVAVLVLLLVSGSAGRRANGQDVTVEHSKPVVRTDAGLGTTRYRPTPAEQIATKNWSEDDLNSSSPETTRLKGKPGRQVAWFGIVRDVLEDKAKTETRL